MVITDAIQLARNYREQFESLVAPKQFQIPSEREGFLAGYWALLLDFHEGILVLLERGCYGAAFSLVRPIVEILFRAHLVVKGAPEDLLKIKNDKYRTNFKTVGAELDAAFELDFFEKTFKDSVQDALHSYTHVGGHQLKRRFDGNLVKANYSDKAILDSINLSTTALFMVTNLFTKVFEFDAEWQAASQLFTEYKEKFSK